MTTKRLTEEAILKKQYFSDQEIENKSGILKAMQEFAAQEVAAIDVRKPTVERLLVYNNESTEELTRKINYQLAMGWKIKSKDLHMFTKWIPMSGGMTEDCWKGTVILERPETK